VVQLRAPTVSRGRVLGLFMMALGICYPVGAVVEGAIAGATGIREVTVGGALVLLGVLGLVLVLRPSLLAALGDPPARPPPGGGADDDRVVVPTVELP